MNIVKTTYNGVIINLHYYFDKFDEKREIRFLLFRLLSNHRNENDTIAKFKADKLSLYSLSSKTNSYPYRSVDTYSASFTFVNPKLIKDDTYESDIINLIKEMYISRTSINEDIFNRTKNETIEEIKALDDSIASVAGSKVDELLFNEEVEKGKIYGELNKYYDITYLDILNELPNFLNSKNFKVSVLGDLEKSFLNKLNKILKPREEFSIDRYHDVVINSYDEIIIDKSNKFPQTLIRLIYQFDNINNDLEVNYKLSVFANLLGVSSVSYLFEEIREAKGYCYYIQAKVNLEKPILEVISLVSSNKYIDAINDISDVVSRVLKDFEEERLENSKKRIKESLLTLKDQAYYESYNQKEEHFLKRSLTLDKMIKIIDKTTKDEILLLTKSVKPVLKYALVGENDEEN